MKDVSHSFNFCTKWTSACYWLDHDQCHPIWRCSSNNCKPHMMWVGTSNVDSMKYAGNRRCGNAMLDVRRLICAGYEQCTQVTSDIATTICAFYEWCWQAKSKIVLLMFDSCGLCPKLRYHCLYAKGNAGRPWSIRFTNVFKMKVMRQGPIPMFYMHFGKANVNAGRPRSTSAECCTYQKRWGKGMHNVA